MVRPSAFLIRGGGGYGDPLERAVEEVADDVRQGYVSVKAAELYGAVVDPDTLVVDRAATERRRAARVPSAIAAVRHS
jgi:N-methylhydantoinase B